MKVLIPMHTAKGLALFHAQVSSHLFLRVVLFFVFAFEANESLKLSVIMSTF